MKLVAKGQHHRELSNQYIIPHDDVANALFIGKFSNCDRAL